MEKKEKKEVAAKAPDEIDAIFAEKSKKRKKKAEEQQQQQRQPAEAKTRKRKKKKTKKASAAEAQDQAGPRKKTQEGFNVFKEEELGFNKKDAGGTPLCPFDCNCCF